MSTTSDRHTKAGLPVTALVAFAHFAAGCSSSEAPDAVATDDGRGVSTASTGWPYHGRDQYEQRFSPLDAINPQTVARLSLAWYHEPDTERGQEATPIVVDGVMYVSHAWSTVSALDAATGRRLWHYDPQVPREWGQRACCDVVNRGVAVHDGKVFVGTLDGRLVALDAATGTLAWETLTIDPTQPYTITGAPRIVRDMVVIGNGGAEYGVRGYVSAYDAATGALGWRFHTVPGRPDDGFENEAMAMAAETWSGEWWQLGGGGTVWDSIVFDPGLDLLYIGVGNGTPWNQAIRSPGGGDNLFLASIVALRPATGEYVWHYQTTPGETWDYTATQPMMLADLTIDGVLRQVLMQAPKNGFFYVLDRATGELISAENFVDVNWATGIDMATGRPIEVPEARYGDTGIPFVATPGPTGGHSWQPMSYSPLTGLVYVPVKVTAFPYIPDQAFETTAMGWNTGVDFAALALPPQDRDALQQALDGMGGHLLAWDPVAQREAWRIERHGPWHSGTLATAGNLVFQGTGQGYFTAQRADTGEPLWSFAAQGGIMAGPITYEVDGVQYVAVSVGWGGAFGILGDLGGYFAPEHDRPRVLAFRLDGDVTLPEPGPAVTSRTMRPPPDDAEESVVAAGNGHYHRYCTACHGAGAVAGAMIPDLRYSPTLGDSGLWSSIAYEGALSHRGMIGFSDALSRNEIEAVRAYVVRQARLAVEAGAVPAQ
jgi:quinohemoprotein ethanol dehydrogenase